MTIECEMGHCNQTLCKKRNYKYYKNEYDSDFKDPNKKNQYYLQICKKFAEQSNVECAKHSALLIYDEQILSVGVNRYILSKFNSRHSHLYFTNNREYKNKYKINSNFDAFTIHAEIDVFIKAYTKIPKNILKQLPLTLYVVRSQNHCLTLSKPCDKCQKFLKQFKYLKIYFSI
jgi:deoxycytidylate deaminase